MGDADGCREFHHLQKGDQLDPAGIGEYWKMERADLDY